jgi:hypothetical protein
MAATGPTLDQAIRQFSNASRVNPSFVLFASMPLPKQDGARLEVWQLHQVGNPHLFSIRLPVAFAMTQCGPRATGPD